MRKICFIILSAIPFLCQGQISFDSLLFVSDLHILFETAKWDISAEDSIQLEQFINTSSEYDQAVFKIEAHTDDIGKNDYNQGLSKNRALSVVNFLERRGMDSIQIVQSFHGEELPRAENETEVGRQQNRRAKIELFKQKQFQWISGAIKDSLGQGLRSNIKLHSKTYEAKTSSDSTGEFKIIAPSNEVVGLNIQSKGHLLQTKMFKVSPKIKPGAIQITLDDIKVGKRFSLDRLFFVGNKDILKESSKTILPSLLEFMEYNDSTCIEIAGHVNVPNADDVAKDSWSFHLSVARSQRVYEYLSQNSIDPKRMIYKGYGNWEMIWPKARSPMHQDKNRRVEVRIIKCTDAALQEHDIVPAELDFGSGQIINY